MTFFDWFSGLAIWWKIIVGIVLAYYALYLPRILGQLRRNHEQMKKMNEKLKEVKSEISASAKKFENRMVLTDVMRKIEKENKSNEHEQL